MSRPSRICSVIDCGRVHYAHGYCERCYRALLRKKRASDVPVAKNAAEGKS